MDLSPRAKEERDKRIELILKKDNYEDYKLIRNLNKMQELAESYSKSKNKE